MTGDISKDYKSLDFDALKIKTRDAIMFFYKNSGHPDAEVIVFNYVKEAFSFNELVYLATIHIGTECKDKLLKNPDFAALVSLMVKGNLF